MKRGATSRSPGDKLGHRKGHIGLQSLLAIFEAGLQLAAVKELITEDQACGGCCTDRCILPKGSISQ